MNSIYNCITKDMMNQKVEDWKTRMIAEGHEKDVGKTMELTCAAKRVIFGERLQSDYQANCKIAAYIIKEIAGLDEQVFDKLYNTKILTTLRIKGLVTQITKHAPIKIKKNCRFNNKNIFFYSVFPEYAKEHCPIADSLSIYSCSGDLKMSLKRASAMKLEAVRNGEDKDVETKVGKFKKERTIPTSGIYGADVDELLYNAISDVLNDAGFYQFDEKLEFLAHVKETYKNALPGIYNVIDNRGCYDSYLDLFMLNAPIELQESYLGQYLQIKKEVYGLDEFSQALLDVYKESLEMEL